MTWVTRGARGLLARSTVPPHRPTTRYGAARRGLTVPAGLVTGQDCRIDPRADDDAPGTTVRLTPPRTP